MTYIKEHVVKEIESKGAIEDVIGEYVSLKRSGSSLKGDCPFCNAKDKFNVSKQKNIWKCWTCDTAGVGYVQFVRKIKNIDYLATLKFLAEKFNITLEYEQAEIPMETPNRLQPGKSQKANKTLSFRDIQLKESGLSEVDQKYRKRQENLENGYIEIDRYQKGSVNPDWSIDPSGDDMVMH
ncbi:MAG: CHC2 zinc finger domain-containing protein, partial [Bacteroidia bacterium]|nr:CHC2 zinc finger domain-containing protein [Bacteroidia bacterium]